MKKSWIYILPVSIFVLGCLLHYSRGKYGFNENIPHNWGMDDAYISYRYGWNLAHFNILSWNESGFQRTEGFTNPLWVLVSATWSLLGNKDWVYPLSVLTSVIISLVFLVILIRLVYSQNDHTLASILGIASATVVPVIWLHMTSGLESGVFGIGLAVLTYMVIFPDNKHSQPYLIVILTIFLGLLRSDGFIYLGIILISAIIAGSKSWKFVLFGFIISVLILFIWRYLTFETFLPNTAIAKVNFGLIERIPIALLFMRISLLNSGLIIFLIFGLAGLWLESRRIWLAGLFLALVWLGYYLYIGGDVYIERHLVGLYFLMAGFSATLWRVAKPRTRILFVVVILLSGFVSIRSYQARFSYWQTKPNDPWIMLGKALESDRERYGVLVIFTAGKIPYYAGGENIDLLGLNDPYLATQKQEQFFPGHSAGSIEAAIDLASSHPLGIYSTFSYLDPEFIQGPEDISLWITNNPPQEKVQTHVTKEQWEAAISEDSIYVWSIISQPKKPPD